MRQLAFAVALFLGNLTIAAARTHDSPVTPMAKVPGAKVVRGLGILCPKEAPLAMDCNGDGVDDLLSPAYHVGAFHHYLEAGTFGLIGALNEMQAFTGNANFSYAGAIDGVSQKPLWSFQAGALINAFSLSPERKHLYIASHDDRIVALELGSGKVVWQQDLKKNILGFAISPHEVIATSADNVVKAFNPMDGSALWEKQVKVAVMASPEFGVMLADDKAAYVSTLDNAVHSLERRSGKERWAYQTEGNPSLRLVTSGLILVADKKALIAIDAESGGLRWKFNAGGYLHAQPLLDLGGAVAFLQPFGEPRLAAVDLATGKLRWSVAFEKAVRDKKREIVVPEDTSLFKTALLVKRDAEGHAEILFAADRQNLKAVRAGDGKELWATPVKEAQALLLSADRLVAADRSRVIHSLGATDGAERWKYDAGKQVSQLARLGDALFATLYSADLVVLGFEDGKTRGTLHLGRPYRLVPEGDDRLILCSESGTLELAPPDPAPSQ